MSYVSRVDRVVLLIHPLTWHLKPYQGFDQLWEGKEFCFLCFTLRVYRKTVEE